MKKFSILIIISTLMCTTQSFSADKFSYDYSGEISLQGGGYSLTDSPDYYAGLRALPFFQSLLDVSKNSYINFNISVNGFSSYVEDWDNKLELYRLSLTYQSLQTEVKVGLQKITFGPAKYLRPLMWFDRINPTDPMQITEGVYGALFRYYTMNNTNIWLWGLYGNEELKGMEQFKTEPDRPEFGGRLQIPLPKGEIAASYHNRKLKGIYRDQEQRLALDGYFDMGVGLWFESSISLMDNDVNSVMATFGTDYTFGIGNGLNVIAEYMSIQYSPNNYFADPEEQLLALSFSYPLNIMDQLLYMSYFSEARDKLLHYLRYQRTYDKYSLNFAIFHYPEIGYDVFTGRQSNIAGLAAQVMAIYNF
ncbi:MAG: hypothetical protein K9M80_04940 [Candidatus Marinimicrobia bacterium]|nr:hypothetical protein [Candidatus Neomarinimicrobiota bacterium]